MTKLAILIAFYRRPEVTRVIMRHYRRMADSRGDLGLIAVGSEGLESRKLADSLGWEYVEAPNRPLSDKLTAGLKLARTMRPTTGLVAMGSDDLVTESWIDRCSEASVIHGLRDMFLLRKPSNEMIYWPGYSGAREGESIGAHRFFPHVILSGLGWTLWPSGLDRNLDGNLTKRLGHWGVSARVMSMHRAECCALGISSETNLTPWKCILPDAFQANAEWVLNQFPEETRADIRSLKS